MPETVKISTFLIGFRAVHTCVWTEYHLLNCLLPKSLFLQKTKDSEYRVWILNCVTIQKLYQNIIFITLNSLSLFCIDRKFWPNSGFRWFLVFKMRNEGVFDSDFWIARVKRIRLQNYKNLGGFWPKFQIFGLAFEQKYKILARNCNNFCGYFDFLIYKLFWKIGFEFLVIKNLGAFHFLTKIKKILVQK